jgi:hypothetical protein
MRKWYLVALLVMGATILCVTVLSGSIATAAQAVSATITGPLDGQGNIKVHEQGTANVNVVGNVPTQEGIPATQFSRRVSVFPGIPAVVSGPDPAGTHYAITSVSFGLSTVGGMGVIGEYGSTSDCVSGDFNRSEGPGAGVPAQDTISMTFPQPFVIEPKSGEQSCLVAETSTNGSAIVVGYRF